MSKNPTKNYLPESFNARAAGCCMVAARIIAGKLLKDGACPTVIEGWIQFIEENGETREDMRFAHTWIELNDEIIDPTFLQFSEYSDYYDFGREEMLRMPAREYLADPRINTVSPAVFFDDHRIPDDYLDLLNGDKQMTTGFFVDWDGNTRRIEAPGNGYTCTLQPKNGWVGVDVIDPAGFVCHEGVYFATLKDVQAAGVILQPVLDQKEFDNTPHLFAVTDDEDGQIIFINETEEGYCGYPLFAIPIDTDEFIKVNYNHLDEDKTVIGVMMNNELQINIPGIPQITMKIDDVFVYSGKNENFMGSDILMLRQDMVELEEIMQKHNLFITGWQPEQVAPETPSP